MKVKELQKTVSVAWSPQEQCPIVLAAGTSAAGLDTSFSTDAVLELYSLNLSDPSFDMQLIGTQSSAQRFHKLVWSPFGIGNQYSSGLIAAGCESGYLQIYNASKILAGENGLVAQQDKHTGPVRALDFNPFQANLLASGATDSELYIWDLNNTATPMTPGAKTQPAEDVQGVAWNRQVQHILASVFSTRCVIWDLRKNEQIIKLSDAQSRGRWRSVYWHPSVATQLWIASEADEAPAVQLWDLRYAHAPAKTLQLHSRGVLGLTGCAKDPDMMASCGKDNKLLCWNIDSEGEVLSEVPTNQWYSDIAWCPRNPALIAASSLDGNVSVYSLFGGSQQQVQTASKIADSFPNMEQLSQVEPFPQTTTESFHDLKKPPKWLKRPAGVAFGFGGKFATFDANTRQIKVSHLVTDEKLVERSEKLSSAVDEASCIEFCRDKAENAKNQHTKYIWHFLKAHFTENPSAELLNLLGYDSSDMVNKFDEFIPKDHNGLSDGNHHDSSLNSSDAFDNIGSPAKSSPKFKLKSNDNMEQLICEAILTGNIVAAVELCMAAGRTSDAIILASDNPELLARTQNRYLKTNPSAVSHLISALVNEDWLSVMENSQLDCWKESLCAALTHSDGTRLNRTLSHLCKSLGERLAEANDPSAILCYICAGGIEEIIETWPEGENQEIQELQDLVEIVVVMQKALQSHNVQGKHADLLAQYASLLAAQGALGTALEYLKVAGSPNSIELRDRLCHALGQVAQVKQMQQPAARRQSDYSTWGQPQMGGVKTHLPQMTQMPDARPPSVGNASKSKYLLDPSVSSGGNYNFQPQATPFQHPTYQQPQTMPFQPQPTLYQPQATPASNFPQMFNPAPAGNYGQRNSFSHGNEGPPMSAPPMASQMPAQYKNPTPPPGWNDPPEPRAGRPQNMPADIKMSAEHAGTKKWRLSHLGGKVKKEITPQALITHPIFGAAEPVNEHQHMPGPYQTDHNQQYGAGGQYIPLQPQQQPLQPPMANQMMPPMGQDTNSYYGGQQIPHEPQINYQNFRTANVPQQQQQQPPPQPIVKEKAPLPEQFIYLQTVFEELKTQCVQTAANPQTKRKLDDVSKRLETLYDLLRENRLSAQTLQALNQMVQCVQIGDYGNGLALHTQMVSGSDFAKIASFMPGIKVLLQLAMQLQIVLR